MKEDRTKGPRKGLNWRLGSGESGRIWAGLGGVIAMAAGAALLGLGAFSADTPAGRVPVAEAFHNTRTQAYLESLPNGSKVLLCHTEGNGTQHSVESAVASVISAGHFNASGAPLHAAGAVHDFIITITIKGNPDVIEVVNTETCGALATETPTSTPTSTPTEIATSTQTIVTSTPTNTPRATNTPTNTPVNTQVTTQATPVPTLTNTPVPTSTRVQQQLGVQATPTPRPPVRALPTTGSGGYLDDSSTTGIGIALLLGGMLFSLTAMRRRAR